ncbi:MAG TPA: ISKra4 family transposase, partial [Gemmata sp.]|nr:ISKra4 family transposase [Gemmata sp.]
MVGTIGFYDKSGERQHTVYMAATPEYGKATFLDRMGREVARVKALYPQARYVGIADGARGNWDFLEPRTEVQIVDFYHAAEYLSDAADVFFAGKPKEKEQWLEDRCHRLKHESGAAGAILKELKKLATVNRKANGHADVEEAITYFGNQNKKGRMDYATWVEEDRPIGSGVTEAACKVLVKQRL